MSIPINKPLALALQQVCIRERFPQFSYSHSKGLWMGKLQPTAKSPKYLVKITYALYSIPRVFILTPKLHPDAPHIYRESGALCIYYPEDGSWNSRKLLGNTVFPWTAEWLYFYELWLATGQWFGPEAPHTASKSENSQILD
jgi:hypothetical protein